MTEHNVERLINDETTILFNNSITRLLNAHTNDTEQNQLLLQKYLGHINKSITSFKERPITTNLRTLAERYEQLTRHILNRLCDECHIDKTSPNIQTLEQACHDMFFAPLIPLKEKTTAELFANWLNDPENIRHITLIRQWLLDCFQNVVSDIKKTSTSESDEKIYAIDSTTLDEPLAQAMKEKIGTLSDNETVMIYDKLNTMTNADEILIPTEMMVGNLGEFAANVSTAYFYFQGELHNRYDKIDNFLLKIPGQLSSLSTSFDSCMNGIQQTIDMLPIKLPPKNEEKKENHNLIQKIYSLFTKTKTEVSHQELSKALGAKPTAITLLTYTLPKKFHQAINCFQQSINNGYSQRAMLTKLHKVDILLNKTKYITKNFQEIQPNLIEIETLLNKFKSLYKEYTQYLEQQHANNQKKEKIVERKYSNHNDQPTSKRRTTIK